MADVALVLGAVAAVVWLAVGVLVLTHRAARRPAERPVGGAELLAAASWVADVDRHATPAPWAYRRRYHPYVAGVRSHRTGVVCPAKTLEFEQLGAS